MVSSYDQDLAASGQHAISLEEAELFSMAASAQFLTLPPSEQQFATEDDDENAMFTTTTLIDTSMVMATAAAVMNQPQITTAGVCPAAVFLSDSFKIYEGFAKPGSFVFPLGRTLPPVGKGSAGPRGFSHFLS